LFAPGTGFPLQELLASAPHITVGIISVLAGVKDDTRFLQITAPVQPGNSGGPLLDRSGHLLGVIVAKLDALKVAEATGDVPQNVNFALRASVARAFLDAHGIEFKLGQGMGTLSTEDIAERARRFTVVVECTR
jgi:S1-C subfamily serine protease